ncbi:S1 family peptidase [Paenibacillus lignilyticus]|uniref:Peptidase S1 domain-containing protein n=1 Tax=Paenibacillus lignilyticus TaxID=1172615 RepID=A0ABS5CKY8_9BACL|nr:S1 family peptidase [Paenibacillus lignilyticus]MBP3966529.1 hypothetical protein [Paenibacillus lignilyticus]
MASPEILNKAAVSFAFERNSFEFISNSTNKVFRFTKNDEVLFLRITEKSHAYINKIKAEVDWISYLVNNGVHASLPIKTLDNELTAVYEENGKCFIATTVLGGGIGIVRSGGCSTAATGYDGNNKKYIITAGHCMLGTGSTVKQYTTTVGVDYATAYVNGGQDIGLVQITDTTRKISSLVLKNGSTDYDAKFTSTGTVTQGQTVCKAGLATNYTCSTVLSTSYTSMNPTTGVDLPDQIKIANPNWTFQNEGDSGATLWSGEVLHGVMSRKSSTQDANAFATASKISYFSYYWPSINIYLSATPY